MRSLVTEPGTRRSAPLKDLSSRAPTLDIRIDWGLAYELLLSLRMWVDEEDPASYEVGPEWFDGVRRNAPASLLRAVERFSGGHEILFGHLLGLVTEAAPPRDVPRLLARVRAAQPRTLRLHLLGYHLQTYRDGVPRSVISRAAAGDRTAARSLLDGSDSERRPALAHALSLDPDESKQLLLELLEGWAASILAPDAHRLQDVLSSDAASKRQLASELPLDRLLDLAAPGIRYAREPGIDRILLVPSWVGRPWLVMCEHDGTKIFCYGANDQADGENDAPPRELVRRFRALGDESRLRLLRRLSEGDLTLQELADHVGLAKSTVHAHLLALRTSGLIETSVADKRYSLRRGALEAASEELALYLRRARP